MSAPVSMQARIGTCPHGLPMGACPICNGGGGGALKKADSAPKAPEMSWSECSAIGEMLRAQQLAKKGQTPAMQAQLMIAQFEKNMVTLASNISNFAKTVQTLLPAVIAKPIVFVATKILVPMLNLIKDIPANIEKIAQQITQKFVDISDKLSAIFGEMKNAIEKKLSDGFKNVKKKALSLLGLFTPIDQSELEKQVKDNDKTFEIREFFKNIYETIMKDENED